MNTLFPALPDSRQIVIRRGFDATLALVEQNGFQDASLLVCEEKEQSTRKGFIALRGREIGRGFSKKQDKFHVSAKGVSGWRLSAFRLRETLLTPFLTP